jgi:SET domain-containing protein
MSIDGRTSGMFVRTEVRESSIFGHGCFAAEAVAKGTIVCCFTLGAKVITEEEYLEACRAEVMPLMRTGTRYAGKYFTVGNAHEPYTFINHSFEPNLLCHCGVVLARRDIGAGEEMTLDYRYLIDETDVGIYRDAKTGREIRGLPARETLLRTARQLVELVESVEGWQG